MFMDRLTYPIVVIGAGGMITFASGHCPGCVGSCWQLAITATVNAGVLGGAPHPLDTQTARHCHSGRPQHRPHQGAHAVLTDSKHA